ncbi:MULTISPECIES: NADH-dependent flavin oxidoreductase [unclassified Gemella]|uniref:NADH-dependent flavin oxidoreductase n=1 Tax=unclassified Gemella TaxID=2624949 RepID=UPI001072F3B7|nr:MULTISPECIES: NADH-dependent flavin oxidoreductase [unclassified Gemella]MBF0710037.1 NADH-dependent flavin oxidoreductase [Gemella sp. GL1.1]MBF0746116.1 NADH-dependent flavin oxidoreductase [Gemella sp. 19428wG2_WT2a]NYS27381.1 NADH-dependent flavin oxidoreductase [Gemella sp. GL1]TFU60405.1 NADH-dependent flavin oxidoreductase [Gemella sp. WT2a]
MFTNTDLSKPLKLSNGVILKNRFVLSPMVTNSSTSDGKVSQDDLNYALRRANSAPLQITGAAYVDEYGQLFEYGFSVVDDSCIEGLTSLAKAMKSKGAKAILQLTHAGRFSSHALFKYGFVYGPSYMKLQSPIPHEVRELSISQIEDLIFSYGEATKRAIAAGFDGVEISSAQRLLIQTFFSKFSNERQDAYGRQTLESRSKFALDILKIVQRTIEKYANSDFILGFRATPEETRGNQIGYTIEEFLKFMDLANEVANIHYLAVASWGHDVYKNRVRAPGKYQGKLINRVVKNHLEGKIPLMATGGINTPEKSFEAIKDSDFIGSSTPFVVDPEFAIKIIDGNFQDIQFKIKIDDLEELAIPQASFKDIVSLMDYGESLPKDTRDFFRSLEKNYEDRL